MESIKINEYEILVNFNNNNSIFEAKRNGEPWRNLIGDNLVMTMFYRIQQLEEENRLLKGEG